MVDTNVNIRRLVEEYDHVIQVEEVVGEWAFHIEGCPITLKIKVMRDSAFPGMYVGDASHRIQNPRQGGPYASYRPMPTIEDALKDALKGFLMYYSLEEAEETKFEPVDEW